MVEEQISEEAIEKRLNEQVANLKIAPRNMQPANFNGFQQVDIITNCYKTQVQVQKIIRFALEFEPELPGDARNVIQRTIGGIRRKLDEVFGQN